MMMPLMTIDLTPPKAAWSHAKPDAPAGSK
jgi:hypothetical protein